MQASIPIVARLLRLSPNDNIAVAVADIREGDEVPLGDLGMLRIREAIAMGHKVAILPIRAGEKVIKFGCPIGSATGDILPGQHVHAHNLKSDYIPTFMPEPSHA